MENDKSWGQKKHDHIKRWHPEERAQLAARKRSVVFEVIAPSEKAEGAEFAWVCPIPGCGHGIMQPLSVGCSSTERSAHLDARRAHAKNKHPKADPKRFISRGGGGRAEFMAGGDAAARERMMTQRANAAAGRRIRLFQQGANGAHEAVQFITLPPGVKLSVSTSTVKTITHCKNCHRMASGVALLGLKPCKPVKKPGHNYKRNKGAKPRMPLELALANRLRGMIRREKDPGKREELEKLLVLALPPAAGASSSAAVEGEAHDQSPPSSSHGGD